MLISAMLLIISIADNPFGSGFQLSYEAIFINTQVAVLN